MKNFKKLTLSTIGLLFVVELGLLSIDTHNYLKYKYANLNINGKIVCQIDNWFNFSGMAR